jgi:hypothetical protein
MGFESHRHPYDESNGWEDNGLGVMRLEVIDWGLIRLGLGS